MSSTNETAAFAERPLAAETGGSGKGTALFLLMLGALAISIGAIFVRVAETGPVAVAFWRLFIPLPLQYALMRRKNDTPAPLSARRRLHILLAGVFFALDLATWHVSIHYTSIANSSLLTNTMPLFVTLYVWLFRGERFSAIYLMGLGAALAGILALMGKGFGGGEGGRLFGDGMAIVAAIFYSGYFLIIASARRHASTIAVMFWAGLAGSALLLPLSMAMGEKIIPDTLLGWADLFALAILSQIVGQFLIAHAVQKVSPAAASVALFVQPVAAALFAALLLEEPLGWREAAGGALVLSGIATVQWSERRKTQVEKGEML